MKLNKVFFFHFSGLASLDRVRGHDHVQQLVSQIRRRLILLHRPIADDRVQRRDDLPRSRRKNVVQSRRLLRRYHRRVLDGS